MTTPPGYSQARSWLPASEPRGPLGVRLSLPLKSAMGRVHLRQLTLPAPGQFGRKVPLTIIMCRDCWAGGGLNEIAWESSIPGSREDLPITFPGADLGLQM